MLLFYMIDYQGWPCYREYRYNVWAGGSTGFTFSKVPLDDDSLTYCVNTLHCKKISTALDAYPDVTVYNYLLILIQIIYMNS